MKRRWGSASRMPVRAAGCPGRTRSLGLRLAGPERLVGSAAFAGVPAREAAPGASLVHVSRDGVAIGTLELHDEPRPTALAALAGLRALGLEVELLSGDQPASVAAFAAMPHTKLSIDAKLAPREGAVLAGPVSVVPPAPSVCHAAGLSVSRQVV